MITSEPSPIGEILAGLAEHAAAVTAARAPRHPDRIGVQREPLPQFLRRAVLARDAFTCWWCFASAARRAVLEIDHIVPWSAGGADHPVNLRTLCQPCNQGRSNRYLGDEQCAPLIMRACPSCMTYNLADYLAVDIVPRVYCLGCGHWGRGYDAPGLLVGGPVPTEGVPAVAS